MSQPPKAVPRTTAASHCSRGGNGEHNYGDRDDRQEQPRPPPPKRRPPPPQRPRPPKRRRRPGTGQRHDRETRRRRNSTPTTAASSCSRGGLRGLNDGAGGREQGRTAARERGRHRGGDGDDDNHHLSAQDHCGEQLLTGWERVLLQNERTATSPRRGKQRKKAQGTSFDVPWAVGKFFFFSFHYFIANKHFYTGFICVTTTLQAPGRDNETAKGRPTTTERRGDGERRKQRKVSFFFLSDFIIFAKKLFLDNS